jgi:hypothetical protein
VGALPVYRYSRYEHLKIKLYLRPYFIGCAAHPATVPLSYVDSVVDPDPVIVKDPTFST